jgi:hypothetical protein
MCVYFRRILYHAQLTMPPPAVWQTADLEPQSMTIYHRQPEF